MVNNEGKSHSYGGVHYMPITLTYYLYFTIIVVLGTYRYIEIHSTIDKTILLSVYYSNYIPTQLMLQWTSRQAKVSSKLHV